MDPFIIPLTNEPIETFTMTLDGLVYRLKKQWVVIPNAWTLDIEGLVNDVSLKGLGLSTNVFLLAPHAILELGELIMIDTEAQNKDPDYDGMGTRFQLFYAPKGSL
jgi:hypothetical protein